MSQIKTAISIRESLFKEMDAIAHRTHIPRSRLFEKAVIDFLSKQETPKLLKQLNMAYGDKPTAKERKQQELMKAHHRKLVEGQW